MVAVRRFHNSAVLIIAGEGMESHTFSTFFGMPVKSRFQLQFCFPYWNNAFRPISMGLGGKYCAGTCFCFNLRIYVCILALISLSASPCFNQENMLVSVTSAAFDNNMSHYFYLKGFNTVRTNTIWNVNTEEVLQRHLLVAARAPECQDSVAVSGATREPKGTEKYFVLDKAQKDGKRATVWLLL